MSDVEDYLAARLAILAVLEVPGLKILLVFLLASLERVEAFSEQDGLTLSEKLG